VESLSRLPSQVKELSGRIIAQEKAFRRLVEKNKELKGVIEGWEVRGAAWRVREDSIVKGRDKAVEERDVGRRVNKELAVRVKEIREQRERAEDRIEEERGRMTSWARGEEGRLREWVERERERAREWLRGEVRGERERVERMAGEGGTAEVVTIARGMAKVRRENNKLREENEHLKRELRRAAERIVNMVREREEGVKDLGFVHK
jgi:hypothetical protein